MINISTGFGSDTETKTKKQNNNKNYDWNQNGKRVLYVCYVDDVLILFIHVHVHIVQHALMSFLLHQILYFVMEIIKNVNEDIYFEKEEIELFKGHHHHHHHYINVNPILLNFILIRGSEMLYSQHKQKTETNAPLSFDLYTHISSNVIFLMPKKKVSHFRSTLTFSLSLSLFIFKWINFGKLKSRIKNRLLQTIEVRHLEKKRRRFKYKHYTVKC